VHDFRIGGAFADPLYQIQFGYNLSVFANDLNRIQADNPCFGNGAPCSAAEAGGPATGQSSLPPSNMAHALNVAGGVNLPLRTRINGNFAWGLQLQNADFLPHTINPVLASSPGLALPRNSLSGLVQTWLVYLSATSRPFDPVTFSAKYRFYDYSDYSQKLTFQNVALNDSALEPTRFAPRYSFNKQNAELDARTRFLEIFALTTGVAWERWDRNEHREVPISNEYFAKLALDATPTEWLLARIGYTPSFRRINEYKTISVVGVLEDPGSPAALQGQSLLLRKFDEADRDRNMIQGQLQFTFANGFTATPSGAWRFDSYTDSPLGLQNETGWSVGIDLGWTPLERVTFSVGYTYEQFLQKMRSRSRPVSSAGNALDFHDFDWVTELGDTVQTAYLGVKAALIPKVLDLRIDSAFSNALGRTQTSNPTTPFSGTAAQNATATAKPFPAFQDTLIRVEAQLIYYFLKNWSARLGYAFEKFDKNDWRTDTLNPYMGVSSIWLANDLKNYTAHMMGMTLAYQFK
jgi:MtrB/PioB family decaheme-associated outer membrane protein